MKKFLVITVLALLLAVPAMAATNDFQANADIVIYNPVVGDVTKNMTIKNGSQAESWSYTDSNTLTVTNPGGFYVFATSSAVVSILIKNAAGNSVACALNSTPGTSYVTLPTAAGTYTVYPSTTASCSALCATQTGAASYYHLNGTYTFPTCGVLTCNSPYTLSAASASTSTTCNPPGVSAGPGGGSSSVQTATPTTTTTTPTTPTTTATPSTTTTTTAAAATTAAQQIQTITAEAATVSGGGGGQVASAMGVTADVKVEAAAATKYTAPLVSGLTVTSEAKTAITNFVAYGTPTTKILGAGERAGVINSYKSAFNKVPATSSEWSDAIKIANGRWPSQTSTTAETKATSEFKKVYKRTPNMKQANDNAAVTVISYGLRPTARNLNSEKAAIKSFKAVYGHAPVSAIAWDIVRAVAYSGAKR